MWKKKFFWSFFSNTECPPFPPKIKLCFFCKIGLVSNRLWKKSFMWPYLNELLDSENGIKNKKNYMGANFQRFSLWTAISWEWQLVRSSNFQDFYFIGHGSQSQSFRETWKGHHGNSRWFDMVWLRYFRQFPPTLPWFKQISKERFYQLSLSIKNQILTF